MEGQIKAVPYERTLARTAPTQVDTVEQKRSRRLSKPRTSSSGRGHLRPNLSLGDLNLLTRPSFTNGADTAVLSPTPTDGFGAHAFAERDPPIQSRPSTSEKPRERTKDGEEAVDTHAKVGRLQRTGTMFAKRMGARRSLYGKSMSTLTLHELGDEAELTAESYEWIKDQAERDRMAMKNHCASPGAEENAEVKAPIRRKSLLTPGVATRGTDLLRKPPTLHNRSNTQVDAQARYYNTGLSSTSPLSRIASLDIPGNGTRTPVEASRAATPAELDYGRLGVLRITNGRAISPALTERIADRQPTRRNTSSTIDLNTMRRTSLQAHMALGDCSQIMYDPYAEDAGNPWLEEAEDDATIAAHSQTTNLRRWPTVTSAYSQSDYGTRVVSQSSALPLNTDVRSVQPALDNAERNFSTDRPLSALEPTSKTNEDDAMLFEDDPLLHGLYESDFQTNERRSMVDRPVHISQLAKSRILDSMMAASRLTPLPQDEEFAPRRTPNSESPVSDRPTFSAIDSGYASSASHMSPQKGISPASSISQGSVNSNVGSRPTTSWVQRNLDDQQPRLTHCPLQLPSTTSRPFLSGPNEAELAAEMSALTKESPEMSPHTTTITKTATELETPPKSRQGSPVGKKLQKRQPRPKSMPPPVDRIVITGCTNEVEPLTVPGVPAHMAARNAERWGSRPYHEREPTLPIIPLTTAYATGSENVRSAESRKDQRTPLISYADEPGAKPPPVPLRSARRHRTSRSEIIQKLQKPWTTQSSPIPAVPELRLPPSHESDTMRQQQRQFPPSLSQRAPVHSLPTTPATATGDKFAQNDGEDKAEIDWEQYRRVWQERRKSAGEILKHRPDFDLIEAETEQSERSRAYHRRSRTECEPKPLPSLPCLQARSPERSHIIPSPRATSPGSWHSSAQPSPLKLRREEHESYFPGRYDGGLAFAYEPGRGVGGSAGTRGNTGGLAMRKTGRGDLARGFGVDLSDVPIFVSRG